jgi:transposase InsO family protein
MFSVCLDIFSMPVTLWMGNTFDAILLCVDRLSGWITACPTLKLGLTAEKAAHLLLDKGWDTFGIPAHVHSDMGPQFIGQWWKTMCARLGIQQSLSPPHRPRGNGRAERAGQQILTILKKLHLEGCFNWVEALPRALLIHHNMVGEGGLAPYEIVFGRTRFLPGLPYTPERICEDASQFFDKMCLIDTSISQALSSLHKEEAKKRNSTLPSREEYQIGDLVWVLKPKDLSSQSKLEARWHGPLAVTERLSSHTYVVQDKKHTSLKVHCDQLKPYFSLGEVGELSGLPGYNKQLLKILDSRDSPEGDMEFSILWTDSTTPTWIPFSVLLSLGWQHKIEEYLDNRVK